MFPKSKFKEEKDEFKKWKRIKTIEYTVRIKSYIIFEKNWKRLTLGEGRLAKQKGAKW